MGQTLTHGIYLPDEGERNCYNGLAANWSILDGAVGTIAEHTSALSEKAPLVHTHTKSDITDFPALATVATSGSYNDLNNIPATFAPSSHTHSKSDITDFPAYGTTAGTICEGNDSRLSDARTPVAHTHTKSDVTDLLNSNFIPSANNSYDLGSSSYQWNNLYAKNYYYNGVAWGLDKANEWSRENTYTYSIVLKQTNLEKGELPAPAQTRRFTFTDKNNASLGWLQHRVNTSGDSYLELYVVNKFSDGQLSTQGSEVANSIVLGLHSDGSRYLTVLGDVSPDIPTRVCNLGTSTNKWKTFNGINPGALSLPKIVSSESRTLDRTNWDYTGTTWNTLDTSAMTGWGYIYIENCGATDYILIRRGATNYSRPTQSANPILANDGKYYLYITFPIVQNTSVYALIKTSGTVKTSVVYPCQGNV